ncbi:MAG: hypothetical protein E6R03_12935 [Hyphomicrobiaceae bacterium]|nr:MAG: hypothetical protein E6R03_12935 [Hyphomicrobiaceae bacterium]
MMEVEEAAAMATWEELEHHSFLEKYRFSHKIYTSGTITTEADMGIGGGAYAAAVAQRPTYTQVDVDHLHARIAELEAMVQERDEIIDGLLDQIDAKEEPDAPALVATSGDGWISWYGEDRIPVSDKTRVDVILGNGSTGMGPAVEASFYRWCWLHGGGFDDIIKYRLSHEPSEPFTI